MAKDIVTISTVSLRPIWGDKKANLSRISGFAEAAARAGSNIVVFPEMALTGYDVEDGVAPKDSMQHRLAERLEDGPSIYELAELARTRGIYILWGMPLRGATTAAGEGADVVYNALVVACPDGEVLAYRKMHLPDPEPTWATRGDDPLIVDTPWGPIGVGICYDSYRFPELSRYYAAKGCRIYINATAHAHVHGRELGDKALETIAMREGIYVVTSNLAGPDKTNWFFGGSSIIGPSARVAEAHYYAGMPFLAEGADEQGIYTATIDLTLAKRQLFCDRPGQGGPDWRPDIYRRMLDNVLSDPNFGK